MANTVATVVARIEADVRNFEAGMKKANKRLDSMEKSTKKAASGLDKMVARAKKAALVFGVGLGLREVVRLLGSSIKAFSDLEESVNAVEVQFGEGAAAILGFGKVAAKQVGLSNAEFNQLAVTTGALFSGFIPDAQEAAEATIKLTKRAADMASVFNVPVQDALMAVQAALRGEQEPIRRFGVLIDEAQVKAKAMALGLAKTSKELTTQDKAMARLALIYEQTDKVAGDFLNTQDSLANKQRILAAETEDLKAAFGKGLAPAMNIALSVSNRFITGLNTIIGLFDRELQDLAKLKQVFEFVNDEMQKGTDNTLIFANAVQALVDRKQALKINIDQVAGALGLEAKEQALGLIAVVEKTRALVAEAKAEQDVAVALKDVASELPQVAKAVADAANGVVDFEDQLRNVERALFEQIVALDLDEAAFLSLIDKWELGEFAGAALIQVIFDTLNALEDQAVATKAAALAAEILQEEARNSAFELVKWTLAQRDVGKSAAELAVQTGDLVDALQDQIGAQRDLVAVQNDSEATALDLAQAIFAVANADAAVIAASNAMQGSLGANISAFMAMALAANIAQGDVNRLTEALFAVPVVAQLEAGGASSDRAIARAIRERNPALFTVTPAPTRTGGGGGGSAAAVQDAEEIVFTFRAVLDLIEANQRLRIAQIELGEAQADTSLSSADLANKQLDVVNAYGAVIRAQGPVKDAFEDNVQAFRDAALAAGLTVSEVDALTESLFKIGKIPVIEVVEEIEGAFLGMGMTVGVQATTIEAAFIGMGMIAARAGATIIEVVDAIVASGITSVDDLFPLNQFEIGIERWIQSMDAAEKSIVVAFSSIVIAGEEADVALRASIDRTIDAFKAAPAKIEITIDEMIANIRAQAQMAVEFESAMRALMEAGLFAVVDALNQAGPAAVDQAAALAADMAKAWELELALADATNRNLTEVFVTGTILAQQGFLDMATVAALAFDAGFDLTQIATQANIGFLASMDPSGMGFTAGHSFSSSMQAALDDGQLHVSIEVTASGETTNFGQLIPTIPQLRHGGIATSATLATIGEGGLNEAVIPLDSRGVGILEGAFRRFGTGGTGNVTVIVEGSVITERDLALTVEQTMTRLRKAGAP